MTTDSSSSAAPFPFENVPPEILELARQTFGVEGFLSQVRESEAMGDPPLNVFIQEVEARAAGR